MKTSDKQQARIMGVMLTWNTSKDTIECVESLQHISTPIDLLIIDNASSDEEWQLLHSSLQQYEIELIRNPKNRGFAGGMNQGMQLALDRGYEYVLIMNNDITVAADCIAQLQSQIESDERIAIAGPKILYADSERLWHTAGVIDHFRAKADGLALQATTEPTTTGFDFLTGTFLLIRTQALHEVGLFDPIYFAYLEDMDLSQRMLANNWKLAYNPHAHIWHKVSQSMGGSAFKPIPMYLRTRNRIIYQRKHASVLTRILFFAYHTTFMLTFAAFGMLKFEPEMTRSVVKGYIAGYLQPYMEYKPGFPYFYHREQ